MSASPAHLVRVDRHKKFTSATLPAPALVDLESAFRRASWWGDRWRSRLFRAAARQVLREHGGLVLLGPRLSFEVPPPFHEMFEPIEIAYGLGTNRERLKTISGDAPTRQERHAWIAWALIALFLLGMAIPVFLFLIRGVPRVIAISFPAMLLVGLLIGVGIVALRRLSGRWFLVPGAIAVVRRPARGSTAPRITVLSRMDSCLVLRYVQQGKTTVLMVELWTHAGKQIRTAVSEREAISILAAWQSKHPPPEDRMLNELVSW